MKVLVFLIIVILSYNSLFSQGMKNNGAKIFTNGKMSIIVSNTNLKNTNNGEILIDEESQLTVDKDCTVESGLLKVEDDNSQILIKDNLYNNASGNVENYSKIIVLKNIINQGAILNNNIIEIGTCF